MAHGKHLSRSFKYGVNPEEIEDDDGYATYTPTLCSRTSSVAPSPALAKALLNNKEASDDTVQGLINRKKGTWSAVRNYKAIAEKQMAGQWPDYLSGPVCNPIEGLFRTIAHPNQYISKQALPSPHYNDAPASPGHTLVTDSSPLGSAVATPTSFRSPRTYAKQWTRRPIREVQAPGAGRFSIAKRIFRPRSGARGCASVNFAEEGSLVAQRRNSNVGE
ncbi:hypothetical protein LTR85_009703 [Meristemomyces frigidus]|nr:hypothetical protein LTR85_009703 [Meristemomyces frigidus]